MFRATGRKQFLSLITGHCETRERKRHVTFVAGEEYLAEKSRNNGEKRRRKNIDDVSYVARSGELPRQWCKVIAKQMSEVFTFFLLSTIDLKILTFDFSYFRFGTHVAIIIAD